MPDMTPEERQLLIQAMQKKMSQSSAPQPFMMARTPEALSAPGFDIANPSTTARGFAPPPPPEPPIAVMDEPIAPPAPPVARPAAPLKPMATMADTEIAPFATPEPEVAPPAEEPLQLPNESDVIGKYTPEAREALREKLESKARLGLIPSIFSIIGDAGANSSGMGTNSDGTGQIIKRLDEQKKVGMEDFDAGRKQKIEDYLTNIKARTAGREEAVANDNADASSALSAAKRKVLQSIGYTDDLSGLSGAQMDPIIKSYLTKYTADQDAESKRLTREAMAGERATKKDEKLRGLEVPGWKLSGEVLPDDTEAKKARDVQANFESFQNSINSLKGLVDKYGTVELTGPESNEMEALTKDLQLTLKNIAQLGVLSASDVPFLVKQVPDVNTMRALFTSSGTFKAGLDQSLKTAKQKYGNFMKSRGYVPSAGGHMDSVADPSAGGKIKVSNGKETLLIDPADAADAEKDGYARVE